MMVALISSRNVVTFCFTNLVGRGFPGGSDGKESTCNAGDSFLIPGSGRYIGEGHGNPL